MALQLEQSWLEILEEEFQKSYFQEIRSFLTQEIENKKVIFPHPKNILAALNTTPIYKVKVIILGQDPYHGAGQAHGLSFSVRDEVKVPPSLQNIYKELKLEYPDYIIPNHGNLTAWAAQGVLLLNSILTVESGKPASHSKIGWETFTDSIISKLSEEREGLVFLLWGNFARSKKVLIDENKHYILEAPHPSPFSAHNGFFGCGHFRKANEYLEKKGKEQIKW